MKSYNLAFLWYTFLSVYHFCVAVIGIRQIVKAYFTETDIPVFEDGKKHVWKYISAWVLVINQVYYHTCFIHQLVVRRGNDINLRLKKRLEKFLARIFFSLLFPLTLMICIIFWGIFMHNRELIYPAVLDKFFPTFYCHIYHTVPGVFLLIEVLKGHKQVLNLKLCLKILCSVTVTYIALVFKTYIEEEKWIYLVFYEMTVLQSVVTQIISFILFPILLLFIIFEINTVLTKPSKFLEIKLHSTSIKPIGSGYLWYIRQLISLGSGFFKVIARKYCVEPRLEKKFVD